MKNLPIQEIMSSQVQKLDVSDDVIEAKRLMEDHQINHLPIMNENQLVGIISSNDISQIEYLCDFIGEKLERSGVFRSLSLEEIMTKDVVSLNAQDSLAEAIKIFSNVSFQSLPVLDEGQLIGIVTAKDVFRSINFD